MGFLRAPLFVVLFLAVTAVAAPSALYLGLDFGGWPDGWPAEHYIRLGAAYIVVPVAGRLGELVAGQDVLLSGFFEAVSNTPGWETALKIGWVAAAMATVLSFCLVYSAFAVLWPKPDKAQAPRRPIEATGSIKDPAALVLGKTAIPRKYEPRNTLAVGSIGTGKSQTIRAAVKVAKARKEGGLILDIGGELTSRLYRPGHDYLIGAHDERGAAWSPLAEMGGEYDAERIAAAMSPIREGPNKEWSIFARQFIEGVLVALWRKHEQGEAVTNATLMYYVMSKPASELREEFDPEHPSAGFVGEGNDRMFANIRGGASANVSGLKGLPSDAGFNSWSIASWAAEADKRDACIFVPVPSKTRDAAFPLASLVAGFVVDAVLGMTESDSRRIWFICDELGQYPQISALARAQTLGRKYGLACVHAVQTIAQLKECYGREGAQILLSCYGNKMIYRCGDGETAEWASKEIGDQQIIRTVKSSSNSKSAQGASNSSSTSEQYSIERSVLASDIQAAADLTAWLLTPALSGTIKKTRVHYLDIGPQVHPDFVPRKAKAKAPSKRGGAEVADTGKAAGVAQDQQRGDTTEREAAPVNGGLDQQRRERLARLRNLSQ